MIDSPDRLGWIRLSQARIAGLKTGNWFKFFFSEAVGLFLFIIGNLGVRFLGFISLFKFKTSLKNNIFVFILVFSILSFLIPLLFIQSGNPWNTIQFAYYGLYMAAVMSGVVISWLITKFPKLLSIPILFVVIILTPVNSITTASYYTGLKPHALIDLEEIQALSFLSQQKDGIVLTLPYNEKLKNRLPEPWPLFAYGSTAYVSALSKKPVFLEDEMQNQILLTDYKKRIISSKDFFINPKMEFLARNKISYIYQPKIVSVNINIVEYLPQIKKIFENNEIIIYQVK